MSNYFILGWGKRWKVQIQSNRRQIIQIFPRKVIPSEQHQLHRKGCLLRDEEQFNSSVSIYPFGWFEAEVLCLRQRPLIQSEDRGVNSLIHPLTQSLLIARSSLPSLINFLHRVPRKNYEDPSCRWSVFLFVLSLESTLLQNSLHEDTSSPVSCCLGRIGKGWTSSSLA